MRPLWKLLAPMDKALELEKPKAVLLGEFPATADHVGRLPEQSVEVVGILVEVGEVGVVLVPPIPVDGRLCGTCRLGEGFRRYM